MAEQVITPTLVNAEHFEVERDQIQEMNVDNHETSSESPVEGEEDTLSQES